MVVLLFYKDYDAFHNYKVEKQKVVSHRTTEILITSLNLNDQVIDPEDNETVYYVWHKQVSIKEGCLYLYLNKDRKM